MCSQITHVALLTLLLIAGCVSRLTAAENGESLINAFIATYAKDNIEWRTDVALVDNTSAPIPPGKQMGYNSIVGTYTFRPKTWDMLTPNEKAEVMSDPRLKAFIISTRVAQENPQYSNQITNTPRPRQAPSPRSQPTAPPAAIPKPLPATTPLPASEPSLDEIQIPPTANPSATPNTSTDEVTKPDSVQVKPTPEPQPTVFPTPPPPVPEIVIQEKIVMPKSFRVDPEALVGQDDILISIDEN